MDQQRADAEVERFHPTNGRISGYLGLLVAAVVLVLAVRPLDAGRPLGTAILALLGGLLVWVVLLRPAMWATDRELVMRGMFHTDTIPLASIDRVAVGQVTAVSSGTRRYVSPVVGYAARHTAMQFRGRRKPASAADTYQVFVEERITQLARESRDRYGAADAVARRTYAWPEISGAVVLLIAFLVWLLAS